MHKYLRCLLLLALAPAFAQNTTLILLRGNGLEVQSTNFNNALASSLSEVKGLQALSPSQLQTYHDSVSMDPKFRDQSDSALWMQRFKPNYVLRLDLSLLQTSTGRYKWVPTFGVAKAEKHLTIQLLRYADNNPAKEILAGTLSADTTLKRSWCGVLECTAEPITAKERAGIENILETKLAQALATRLKQLLDTPQK